MKHPDHVLWWISPPEYESLVVQGLVDELPGYIKRSLQQMRSTQARGRVHVDPEIPADVGERVVDLEWPNHELCQYLRRWCAGVLVQAADLHFPALCVGIVTDLGLQLRLHLPWMKPQITSGLRAWVDL